MGAKTTRSKHWAQKNNKKTYPWPGLFAWLVPCWEMSLLESLRADHLLVLRGETDAGEGSAADSSLSSSFLEPLLKMNLQLQDYTCTGDACGSQ